jgi:hypothetical protein
MSAEIAVKVMRKIPHPEDEAQFAGELVRGYCAFDGAPESVWQTMGDDRSEVEETRSSALEVSRWLYNRADADGRWPS